MTRIGEYPIPARAKVEHCRSCGASITWAKTKLGRLTPLDLRTVEHRDGQRFALTHWVSCPNAREWRHGPAAPAAPQPQELSAWGTYVAERRERVTLADGAVPWCWWLYGRKDFRSEVVVSEQDIAREALAALHEEDGTYVR